jgi:hypothetical protein
MQFNENPILKISQISHRLNKSNFVKGNYAALSPTPTHGIFTVNRCHFANYFFKINSLYIFYKRVQKYIALVAKKLSLHTISCINFFDFILWLWGGREKFGNGKI